MPFLDTLIIPQPDGSLTTTVFRKPAHTDEYLQWDSCHAISAKYSMINTQLHRAKAGCSTTQHLEDEQEHLQNVLTRCKYPTWTLNRIRSKIRAPNHPEESHKGNKQSTRNSNRQRGYIMVPYTEWPKWKYQNCLQKTWDTSVPQRRQTINDLLVAPRDKDPITKNSGVIDRFKCERMECDKEYIGESSRTLGERFKEHLKPLLQYMTILT